MSTPLQILYVLIQLVTQSRGLGMGIENRFHFHWRSSSKLSNPSESHVSEMINDIVPMCLHYWKLDNSASCHVCKLIISVTPVIYWNIYLPTEQHVEGRCPVIVAL